MKNHKLIAKTFSGLEYVLADELKSIGAKNIRAGHRATFFDGDLETIYKANYFLRTALRILKEITNFQFKNVDQFYLKCKNVKWSDYFGLEQNFVINSTVVNSQEFRNSMFASLRVKDAIVDRIRKATNKRPTTGSELSGAVVYLFWKNDEAELFLDTTGASLARHGYRKMNYNRTGGVE